MSRNEFEEDIEPFLGREVSVKLVVCRIGIFKTAEHVGDALHPKTLYHDDECRKPGCRGVATEADGAFRLLSRPRKLLLR